MTDPKSLIHESYRIDGISDAECRSILIDWALSLPDGQDQKTALADQLALNEARNPDHPMTALLRAGLETAPKRSGRRKRVPERQSLPKDPGANARLGHPVGQNPLTVCAPRRAQGHRSLCTAAHKASPKRDPHKARALSSSAGSSVCA